MDGNAILMGFASCPGPDWLKDVVSKVGLRLKVYSALRALHQQSQVSTDTIANPHYINVLFLHSHTYTHTHAGVMFHRLHLQASPRITRWHIVSSVTMRAVN